MSHLVLLGDSIFDNVSYVPGGPSVQEHLRRILPSGWRVTLLARDGHVTADVAEQLARLPDDATHLVVSVGGNDALAQSLAVLSEETETFIGVLTRLAEIRDEFQRDYLRMLDAVLAHGKPTAVCTVYDRVPGLRDAEKAGLALFNEVITREAFRAGVDLIDLRHICDEPTDYSSVSPIEPSDAGGGKIARAIVRSLTDAGRGSRVIA